MVDKNGSMEEIEIYLSRARSLSSVTKENLKALLGMTKKRLGSGELEDRIGLVIYSKDKVYVYLNLKDSGFFRLCYDHGIITVSYTDNTAASLLSSELMTEWELFRASNGGFIQTVRSGLDKVIAFKEGKAFSLDIKEIGDFTPESYIQSEVENKIRVLHESFVSTLSSIKENNEMETRRYRTKIEELKAQSLGNLDIKWFQAFRGLFFLVKDPYSRQYGLAKKVNLVIKRVAFHDDSTSDDIRQYWLKTPFRGLPTAVLCKYQDGSWKLRTEDGYVYPHPHVNEEDSSICLGSASSCGNSLTGSDQFLAQVNEVVEAMQGINWTSPYRTDFYTEAYMSRESISEEDIDEESIIDDDVFDIFNLIHNRHSELLTNNDQDEKETIQIE
jgi:hypothetical protein